MLTEEDLETLTQAEYASVEGRVLLVTDIRGYKGGNDHDVRLEPPARVRVVGCDTHWCDGWLDADYDVKLVEPHPQLAGFTSLWVNGTSRHVDGRTERFRWELDPDQPSQPYSPPAAPPRQRWVLEITVDNLWIEDGFDLTQEVADRLAGELIGYAHHGEVTARVLEAPDPAVIRKIQGHEDTQP